MSRVEIYEGDIVSDLYSEYEIAKYDPNQFVIIGNIHQNTIL